MKRFSMRPSSGSFTSPANSGPDQEAEGAADGAYSHDDPPQRPSAVTKRKEGRFRTSVTALPSQNGDNSLDHEGYLQKKGSGLIGWQKRYFTASGHYLKYFSSQADAEKNKTPLAAIDLRMVEISEEAEDADQFEVIVAGQGTVRLKASGVKEAAEWKIRLTQLKAVDQQAQWDTQAKKWENIGRDSEAVTGEDYENAWNVEAATTGSPAPSVSSEDEVTEEAATLQHTRENSSENSASASGDRSHMTSIGAVKLPAMEELDR